MSGIDHIPFIGEIPFVKDIDKIYSAVEDNPRSSVSESIRIAISNFEFINPNTDELSENTHVESHPSESWFSILCQTRS